HLQRFVTAARARMGMGKRRDGIRGAAGKLPGFLECGERLVELSQLFVDAADLPLRGHVVGIHVENLLDLRERLLEAPRIERSEEHTSELQSLAYLVCRLLL